MDYIFLPKIEINYGIKNLNDKVYIRDIFH